MGSCKVIADTVERYVGATGRSFSDVTWLGERGPGQNGAHWSGARVRDRGDPGAGRFSVVDFGELANSRGTPCWIPDTAHRGGLGTVKRRGLFAGFKWLYRFILCVYLFGSSLDRALLVICCLALCPCLSIGQA